MKFLEHALHIEALKVQLMTLGMTKPQVEIAAGLAFKALAELDEEQEGQAHA